MFLTLELKYLWKMMRPLPEIEELRETEVRQTEVKFQSLNSWAFSISLSPSRSKIMILLAMRGPGKMPWVGLSTAGKWFSLSWKQMDSSLSLVLKRGMPRPLCVFWKESDLRIYFEGRRPISSVSSRCLKAPFFNNPTCLKPSLNELYTIKT